MLFHSPSFIICYLIFLGFFRLSPVNWRLPLLGLVSLAWFATFNLPYTALLLLTSLVAWAGSIWLNREKAPLRLPLLLACLAFYFSLFLYFRYFHQSADFPVGLSFFLFQAAPLLITAYQRPGHQRFTLVEGTTFLAFFPQLIAGPIERFHHLMPQLLKPAKPEYRSAFLLFSWGFFKKIAIADLLFHPIHGVWSSDPVGAPALLLTGFLTTVQVYADFSGYCDMGRGLAKALGVELMISFRPFFFAKSPIEFWHRWHISLANWFRDYVVLSMLKKGRNPEWRKILALFTSFLLMGLWHGSRWSWVLFGAYHGTCVILNRYWNKAGLRMPAILAYPLMLVFWTIAGTLHAFSFENPLDPIHFGFTNFSTLAPLPELGIYLFVPMLLFVAQECWIESRGDGWYRAASPYAQYLGLFWILSAILLTRSELSPFVYFNF